MPMVHLTPAEGARVRMPERNSAVMPEAGAWAPRTVHYEGLIASGDVVVTDPQPDMPAPAKDVQPARGGRSHSHRGEAQAAPQASSKET